MPVRRFILMFAIALLAQNAPAVILYSKSARNTTAPAGDFLNSGWQWEGQWGNFTGTVINKKYFITAGHIGGSVGQTFTYNGASYTATATYDDPDSDLQVWKVNHLFKTWAPLYTGTREKGKGIIIFGRGTQRGDPIVVNAQTKGWLWGNDDHVMSWGHNVITDFADGTADGKPVNVPNQQFDWTFDAKGVSNEAALSLGDSGGGVFAKINNLWQLVGINLATQSEFSYPNTTDQLNGAIFDYGGLKVGDQTVTDTSTNIPAKQFATRISDRIGWLDEIFHGQIAPSDRLNVPVSQGVPEPANIALLLPLMWFLKRSRGRIREIPVKMQAFPRS